MAASAQEDNLSQSFFTNFMCVENLNCHRNSNKILPYTTPFSHWFQCTFDNLSSSNLLPWFSHFLFLFAVGVKFAFQAIRKADADQQNNPQYCFTFISGPTY